MTAPSKLEAQQLAAVLKWKAAADELERVKAAEAELRADAIAIAFPNGLEPGTTSCPLHDGTTLKAVVRRRSHVDAGKINAALAALRARFKAMGKLLGERLIKWTPEASIAEWNKLTDEQRAVFDGVIEIRAAGASLELVVPA